jgi:Autophagy-related protein 101
MIEEQIPKLMASLTPVAPDLSRGQLTIAFYEKVTSRKFFGMASSQEKQYWEQWHIRLIVNTHPDETSNRESDGEGSVLSETPSSCLLGAIEISRENHALF